ncbi:MAG: DUF2269 family protein [Saprospiraceae bacterium]|nr:DUF2269 family protein [Saprospiraceae bacterium]
MKLTTSAWVSLANGLFMMLLSTAHWLGYLSFDMWFSYQWHKLLHLVGLVLFMGNLMVGPVWFLIAFYSNDRTVQLFAVRLLRLTDMWLTAPGMLLTIVNGLCLASVYGGLQQAPWLSKSIYALWAMWGISLPLLYLQEKMLHGIESDSEPKLSLLYLWSLVGTVVMVPAALIFYWMVVKV